MEVQHERCAGLDLAKDSLVACARIQSGRKVTRHIETFGMSTRELLRLSEWLQQHRCTHAVMEATGVYWEAVWQILHDALEIVVANAAQVKAVPGRKTDVCDSQWLADLLAHGLVRASFVPPTPIQQLRDLTRTRAQLVREKRRHVQRIHKTLERTNIKLAAVLTDIMGQSGRAIIEAMIAGESDPRVLVGLVNYRVHADRQKIVDALQGRLTDHHRFLLRMHLAHVKQLDVDIEMLDLKTDQQLEPLRAQLQLLKTIPGVDTVAAHVLLAEIGADMSRFPSAGHLVSWAGLCPRNEKSAGKSFNTRIRNGNPWLKSTLVQSARAGARTRSSYLRAQYHRLSARRGKNKATIAVAASMLVATWFMLRDGTPWNDLGVDFFDRRDPAKSAHRLTRRLEALGYQVAITNAPPPRERPAPTLGSVSQ